MVRSSAGPVRSSPPLNKTTTIGLTLVVLLLFGVLRLRAFQGMSAATHAPRPTPKIDTNLPPIKVDFRDIAEQAGLVTPNVSGSAGHKRYILEATGSGVGLFDYDNDG